MLNVHRSFPGLTEENGEQDIPANFATMIR